MFIGAVKMYANYCRDLHIMINHELLTLTIPNTFSDYSIGVMSPFTGIG
jgi:hypothetical protein